MIAKIIRMKRSQGWTVEGRRRAQLVRNGAGLFALTRYILDANPYGLIAEAEREILSITDYAVAAERAGIEPGERVEASGVRNLYADDLAGWQAEMLSVAVRGPKVNRPVIHIVLSLREGEGWTPAEREEAITIVLEGLGLQHCQAIWAEHSNTANAHLHLAVVRIDPATGQAAGTDWLIDDLHQALAIVEERQGRLREPHSLYVARGGAVFDADTDIMVRDASGQYQSGWYKVLGKKHDKLPARLRPKRAEIIAAAETAQDWSALHAALEELNVTYDRSGSGARIGFGSACVKASQVHVSLSRGRLEETLGPFEPDLRRINPAYEAYRHAFEAQLTALRDARTEQGLQLDNWVAATLAALPPEASQNVRRAIKAEGEAAKVSLSAAFKTTIARSTKHRLNEQAWLSGGQPSAPPTVSAPALILPASNDGVEGAVGNGPAFERREHGWSTEYLLEGTSLFTDHRVVIIVHAIDNTSAIDEALKIACARWGKVTVRGPEAFLKLAAARAHVLGVTLLDAQGNPLLVPSPVAEPAQHLVAHKPATRPALEDDPIRQQRIDEVIAYLDRFEGLPLRRRKMPHDTPEAGHTGKLEIVIKTGFHYNSDLAAHAVFDEDPRVQEFLELKRQEAIDEWSILFRYTGTNPKDLSSESICECLPKVPYGQLSAVHAINDHDFLKLLDLVRKELRQRSKEIARYEKAQAVAERPQPQTDKTHEYLQESPSVESSAEMPLDVQAAWLKMQSGRLR